VARANAHVTELEIELLSGRQHQIRRHAVLSGHEVIGDRRYGEARYVARIKSIFGFSRLMLHAEVLELRVASGLVAIHAPAPEEFQVLFAEPEKR
jgi:tRNA pseudouridine65 synthase